MCIRDRALRMHRVRVHGHTSGDATRINIEWCPNCLLCCHTVRRAVHHAKVSSPACEMAIMQNCEPVIEQAYAAAMPQ
eukprot:7183851-Alexandrium_andersonii.AAC.1